MASGRVDPPVDSPLFASPGQPGHPVHPDHPDHPDHPGRLDHQGRPGRSGRSGATRLFPPSKLCRSKSVSSKPDWPSNARMGSSWSSSRPPSDAPSRSDLRSSCCCSHLLGRAGGGREVNHTAWRAYDGWCIWSVGEVIGMVWMVWIVWIVWMIWMVGAVAGDAAVRRSTRHWDSATDLVRECDARCHQGNRECGDQLEQHRIACPVASNGIHGPFNRPPHATLHAHGQASTGGGRNHFSADYGQPNRRRGG